MNPEITIIILGSLVGINYWIKRSVLYPPFLYCLIWLLDLLVYNMQIIEMIRVSSQTLVLITLGALFFSIGGMAALLLPISPYLSSQTQVEENRHRHRHYIMMKIIILLMLIGLGYQFLDFLDYAKRGFGMSLFLDARTAMVQDINEGLTAGSFSNIIDFTTLSIYITIMLMIQRKDLFYRCSLLISIISCVISTGRVHFLLLFSSIICVNLLIKSNDKFKSAAKTIGLPIVLFVLLFSGLIFLNKDTSGMQTTAVTYARDHTVEYVVGPLGGLDYSLKNSSHTKNSPNHTFRVFLRNMARFGLISYTPPPPLDDFVYIPFNVNVFTIYKFYYFDFGYIGMLVAMMVISFIQVILFERARNIKGIWLFIYALTIYPTIMAIFDDQYSIFTIYFNGILIYWLCQRTERLLVLNLGKSEV